MFNKLLSNLPFNPSLIDQVSFYSSRLKKESSIRRLGFGLVALTMAFQIFAVVSPTEASNQASSNDVIRGGFDTQAEAVQRCRSNSYGFGAILLYYGMTCEKLETAEVKTINSSANGNTLYSMGRNPSSINGEYPVEIPSAGKFYLRHLSGWGNFNTKVLSMTTSDGKPFMVMFDCGNIVIPGHYTPPARPEPTSSLKLAKVAAPSGVVKPGDTIKYTLAYSNTGGNAAFFSVNDQLPDQLEYVSSEQGNWALERNGNTLKWHNNTPPFYAFGNTDAFGTPGFITVTARVKQGVPSGTSVCNKGWLIDVNTQTKQTQTWSEVTVCNTVIVDCPENTMPTNDGRCETIVVPDAVCEYLKLTQQTSRTKASFEAKAQAVKGATIKSYTYNFGDGSTPLVHPSASDKDTAIDHDFKKEGTYTIKVTVAASVPAKDALTCQTQLTVKPDDKSPIPGVSKKAKNLTQKIDNANGTTAQAGDVIEYSLTTTNFGDGDLKNYALKDEELADVLEYAKLDLNSLGDGVFEQSTQKLLWNKPVTLKPGESVTKTFKVTIMNPIPSTLRPYGAPGASFDMKLTNVYGNSVEIKLPETILKTIETTTTTLPNTGPGETLVIGGLLTTIVGYFFARSRLLSKELDIVRNEYATASGGM